MAQRLQLRFFCDRSHRCLSHSDPGVWQQVSWTGRKDSRCLRCLLACLTSHRLSVWGFSGGLWRPDGSLLPAARVGSHLLRPTALHSQPQTAEGAVVLRMHARLCWAGLCQPVQRWDISLFIFISLFTWLPGRPVQSLTPLDSFNIHLLRGETSLCCLILSLRRPRWTLGYNSV